MHGSEHLFDYGDGVEIALQQSFDDLGTPLSEVSFVVVDVETTGGSPQNSPPTVLGPRAWASKFCNDTSAAFGT